MLEVSAHMFHNMLNCSIMSRLEDFGCLGWQGVQEPVVAVLGH
jgi:hypothetical protein